MGGAGQRTPDHRRSLDAAGRRDEGRERKGHFKVVLENHLRYYGSADRKELTFVCFW